MYAEFNTSEKLVVTRTNNRVHRFLYEIVNKETGAVIHKRYSNRKYYAATISGTYFGSILKAQMHRVQMVTEYKTPDSLMETYYCYLEDVSAFDQKLPPTFAPGCSRRIIGAAIVSESGTELITMKDGKLVSASLTGQQHESFLDIQKRMEQQAKQYFTGTQDGEK